MIFFSSVSISVASPFDAFTIVYIGMGLMFVAGKPRTFMRKIRGGKWIPFLRKKGALKVEL